MSPQHNRYNPGSIPQETALNPDLNNPVLKVAHAKIKVHLSPGSHSRDGNPPPLRACISGNLPSPLISPQLLVLPTGPSMHTIAVDQNDGQHIILAQHCLYRPALLAQDDLRSCRAHKPGLCAGDRRVNRRSANTGRDKAGLGEGGGAPELPARRRLVPRVLACFAACVLRSALTLRTPHGPATMSSSDDGRRARRTCTVCSRARMRSSRGA